MREREIKCVTRESSNLTRRRWSNKTARAHLLFQSRRKLGDLQGDMCQEPQKRMHTFQGELDGCDDVRVLVVVCMV